MYSTLTPTESDIDEAFSAMEAFIEINLHRETTDDKLDALKLHCQSVGLEEDEGSHLMEKAEEMFGDIVNGYVFLGAILGLRIAGNSLNRKDDGTD